MKLLAKCGNVVAGCPTVYDPQDGTDELIIVGKTAAMVADEECVPCAEDETVVRIAKSIIVDALKQKTN